MTRFRASGVVVAENGVPAAGAHVEVAFAPLSGQLGSWVSTKTDALGRYEVFFETDRPLRTAGLTNVVGIISSWIAGYDPDIQLLPWGQTSLAGNLRLHRTVTVDAGNSLTVLLEPDNAICSDQEDWFVAAQRCRSLDVRTETAGTLTIDARSDGGAVPIVFSATSGWYERQTLGPGTVSLLKVRAGERYRIFVGVPHATPTQQIVVSTSLRSD